jgi:hypothetical protein
LFDRYKALQNPEEVSVGDGKVVIVVIADVVAWW